MEEIRNCKKHGDTPFVTRNDGGHRCKKCAVEAVQKRRDNLKIMSIEYKGGKCSICGYDKYVGALDFHHMNPEEKDFSIADKGYTRSWENTKIELDKCILLCANCHREIHSKEKGKPNWSINKEDTRNILSYDNKHCSGCGNELFEKTKTGLCVPCYSKTIRKVERPSKEELNILIKQNSFSEIGRMFGVSDNSIRKWCKSYDLSYRKRDIK